MPQAKSNNGQVKTFVVDTNVLLHNPNAIFLFADNEVIIPFDVIEELDSFKTNTDDLGRNARTVIRHLDRLRAQGNLSEGVDVKETGGRVRVVLEEDQKLCPGLTANTPDNRIICTAHSLKQQGKRVVFISKDINARIKSDTMGIVTEDFQAQKVDFERLYTGYQEANVPGDAIDTLFQTKTLKLPLEKLYANEYNGQLRTTATHGPSGNTLITDAPRDNMGKGEAFSPTDLVATALATCILTTMGIVAQRHELDMTGATARVTKEMVSSPTRRIGRLVITVRMPKKLGEEDQKRLENAAHTCPVHRSLHPDVEAPITFTWG
jgi:uncharacterized OsmC-like protein